MKVPFPFVEEREAFERSFQDSLGKVVQQRRHSMIPAENNETFSHGRCWVTLASDTPDEESELREHSTEMVIPHRDVVQHNTALLPNHFVKLAEEIHVTFMRELFQTISASTDRSGNKVSQAEAGSPAQVFLEALTKIEFGVDREGKVSLPEFHLSPDAHDNMMASLEAQDDAFRAKIDQIMAEKSEAALKREAERKAKFKRQGRA